MREMHKLKDKAEFSLDNRQIFFLFFGLSVVGCFVFALGVMVGSRHDWKAQTQVASRVSDSLSMLDALEAEGEAFAFKEGLASSTVADKPPTRDPAIPPRDEKEVKAEKAAAKKAAKQAADTQLLRSRTLVNSAPTRASAPAAKPTAKPVVDPVAQTDKTLAKVAAASVAPATEVKKGKRVFTLQMKAFANAAAAESFADKLRRNGHDIRVEVHEARGRKWHRVRLGEFRKWDDAVAAKAEFEKAEHVIAYVVTK